MQNVLKPLQDNLRIIYRKGIDADKTLQQLQQAGHGKHQAIFAKEAGFNTSSTRFAPYIEELATRIAKLENADEQDFKQQLPTLVKQMELLLTTLKQLKQSLKA